MKLYEIANLVTPPIFMKILHKCIENKKKQYYVKGIQKKVFSTINNIEKQSDKLIILANGPSLKTSIEKYSDFIRNNDIYVVNQFCESDFYNTLKPQFYILADPDFFQSEYRKNDYRTNSMNSFFDTFFSKTKWDISLIVPDYAKESLFMQKCATKKNIVPFFYNTKNSLAYEKSDYYFKLLNANAICPPMRNVLNLALYMGIYKKYKEIYIFGAENNFLQVLNIDQQNNSLYFLYEHFYDQPYKQPLYYDFDKPELGTIKLYEFLERHSKTMKLYWDLKEYADFNDVKIYNCSEYSLIDAFERKHL